MKRGELKRELNAMVKTNNCTMQDITEGYARSIFIDAPDGKLFNSNGLTFITSNHNTDFPESLNELWQDLINQFNHGLRDMTEEEKKEFLESN